jgi:hypothetical protein
MWSISTRHDNAPEKKIATFFSGYVIGGSKKSFSDYVSGTTERREALGELDR